MPAKKLTDPDRVNARDWCRMMQHVAIDDQTGCWNWEASLHYRGYGHFCYHENSSIRERFVHRAVWRYLKGDIPEDLTLDHLCENKRCCNPDHITPATHRDNLLRGTSLSAINARKTHCKRGHEFTPDNTYVVKLGMGRSVELFGRKCRICTLNQQKAKYTASRVPAS